MFDADEEDRLRVLVREGFKSALSELGIHDDEAKELRADFKFLREWRKAGERVKDQLSRSVIITSVAAVVGLLVLGFREWIAALIFHK